MNLSGKIKREECQLCQKGIYTHQVILICSLENKPYHAKCLKIDIDTAATIKSDSTWYCPKCLENIFPHFCDTIDTGTIKRVVNNCKICNKSILPDRDKSINCDHCKFNSHEYCYKYTSNSSCCNDRNLHELTFNPYDVIEPDDNCSFSNDLIDSSYDTIGQAKNILQKCRYVNPNDLKHDFEFNGTSFFFNNIDGFASNFDELRNHMLNMTRKFDFYCFNETNLKAGVAHDYEMPGYNFEPLYSIDGKSKGSGLAIYYREDYKFIRNKSMTTRNDSLESIGGKLNCNNGLTLNVLIIYRFVQKSYDTKFVKRLNKLIEKVSDTPTVILGDFNLNLINPDSNSLINQYTNSLMCKGFSPLIGRPTHFKGSSSTCIDHIWTNLIDKNTESGIITISTSAHLPVFATIPTSAESFSPSNEQEPKFIRLPNINVRNIEKFDRLLETAVTCDPKPLYYDNTENELRCKYEFSEYYGKLNEIYSEAFMEDVNVNSNRNFLKKPWISFAIAKSCREKDRLHKLKIKNKNKPNAKKFAEDFNSYRAKLRDIIRAAKNNYYVSRFQKCNGDLKKCWKVINEMRNKQKKLVFPDFLDYNRQLIIDRRTILNLLNKKFVNTAKNLNQDKPESDFKDYRKFLRNQVTDTIFLTDIESSEISRIITDLHLGKASDISVRILKLFKHKLSPNLTILFNNCMRIGYFPDELKVAKVIPLHKGGDKNDLSNYRPISLLPVISKIFEKLIHKRFTAFLTKHRVIYEKQFGFRSQHSTMHALNTAITQISNGLNENKVVLGIFLDFSRAFDTVQTSILLDKLSYYGIRGKAHDLMKSYLSDRYQAVYSNGEFSNYLRVTDGVPQGSVLGPLLFLVYINDLVNSMCGCDTQDCSVNCHDLASYVTFADDTNTFVTGKDMTDAINKSNKVLARLKLYLEANYLHINISKSKYIHFTTPRAKTITNYTDKIVYGTSELERVDEIKFLGVHITSKLNWTSHAKKVANKVRCSLSQLYTMRKSLPAKMRVSVYNALVSSQLSYAIAVWGGTVSSDVLKPLFILQKQALRNIFSIKRISTFIKGHTKQVFGEGKILSIYNLYNYRVIADTYKLIRLPEPLSLRKLMKLSDCTNADMSRSDRIFLPALKRNVHQNSFCYQAPKLWNLLCQNPTHGLQLINAPTLPCFKSRLKKLLLQMQTYGDTNEWLTENKNLSAYFQAVKMT